MCSTKYIWKELNALIVSLKKWIIVACMFVWLAQHVIYWKTALLISKSKCNIQFSHSYYDDDPTQKYFQHWQEKILTKVLCNYIESIDIILLKHSQQFCGHYTSGFLFILVNIMNKNNIYEQSLIIIVLVIPWKRQSNKFVSYDLYATL